MSPLKLFEKPTTGEAEPIPINENVFPAKKSSKQRTALYASTNLTFFETKRPHDYGRDYVGVFGTCFRRLDPDYYSWLRHKMHLAKKAAQSDRLAAQTFDKLRARFNEIHAWAMEHLGEEALRSALQSLDPKTYAPPMLFPHEERPAAARAEPKGTHSAPRAYLFPKDGDWRFTQRVRNSAVPKVDAIRDQALSLGWSEARLYQNRGRFRFPCGEDYGLVCFLDENKRIGQVTQQFIEIVGPSAKEYRSRFFNPDVDQPWIKKKTNEA